MHAFFVYLAHQFFIPAESTVYIIILFTCNTGSTSCSFLLQLHLLSIDIFCESLPRGFSASFCTHGSLFCETSIESLTTIV